MGANAQQPSRSRTRRRPRPRKGFARSCDVRSLITWRGAALAHAWPTREFLLNGSAAKTRENRRLPGTSHRDAFTRGLRYANTRTIELHRAGSFAGAACCNIFCTDHALIRISRGRRIHAKAAPLQALGDRTSHEHSIPIAYEYENQVNA